VYKQGLTADDFEIIVVDDCSPKEEARQCLQAMAAEPQYADNLRLLKTAQNVRQGGARNLAIKDAHGDYIVFIDQDDWLNDGSLSQVKEALDGKGLDVLMVDSLHYKNGDISCISNYHNNSQELMTGEQFLLTNEVPWVPWCYIYRREFLLKNNLWFEENVRFEDVDFVMKVTLAAERIACNPIKNIVHSESDTQQSFIGNDKGKISDLAFIAYRVRKVSESFRATKPEAARVVMSHHYVQYKSLVTQYLWRLPAREVYDIITTYPAEEHAPDRLTRLSVKHPRLTSRLLAAARPLLMTLWRAKRFIEQALIASRNEKLKIKN
jgi:glycosyltransferase involved in cell wall biosynthesis